MSNPLNSLPRQVRLALVAALNKSAPDPTTWIEARDHFLDHYWNQSLEESIEGTLNTSAPDGDAWMAGKAAFDAIMTDGTPPVTVEEIQECPDLFPTPYFLVKKGLGRLGVLYATHVNVPHGTPRPQHAARP